MAQYFVVHPDSPNPRLINQAVEMLRNGGVVAYPTDSSYALGCALGHKEAQDRIRKIRDVGEDHLFSIVCRNLSELANYAQVDNSQFRLLKANTPGAYTFILKATREVPKKLQHPKRSAVGIRVPQHRVAQTILDVLNEPMLSMTLHIEGDDEPLNQAWEIRDRLEHSVDCIIDAGACAAKPSTIIDLTTEIPALIRQGAGDASPFGFK